MTAREFMDFLIYIEHNAENLQFYLWYKDYCRRFAQLPDRQRALSPEWTPEPALPEKTTTDKEKWPKEISAETAAVFKGTGFDTTVKITGRENGQNPFSTPPRTPFHDPDSVTPSTVGWSENDSTLGHGPVDYNKKAAAAFQEVDAMQPCPSLFLERGDGQLMCHSHDPTIPGRNLPHHCHLHCRWRFQNAQLVLQGENSCCESLVRHYPPQRVPRRRSNGGMDSSTPGTSQFHSLDHLQ